MAGNKNVTLERRKENGLCVRCGKRPANERGTSCDDCLSRLRAEYREKRKRSRCSSCGKPTNNGAAQCHRCRGVTKVCHERHLARMRATGGCYACSKPAEGGLRYCVECRDKKKARRLEVIAAGNCERCRNPRGEVQGSLCAECRAKLDARDQMIKAAVFAAYGGAKCACCGITDLVFLTIDHIDGSGAKHRKSDRSAVKIYRWLYRRNFPEGFRVLCMNCNWARRFGPCPHTLEDKKDAFDE